MLKNLFLRCITKQQFLPQTLHYSSIQYFARRTGKNKQILDINQRSSSNLDNQNEEFNHNDNIHDNTDYKSQQSKLIQEAIQANKFKEQDILDQQSQKYEGYNKKQQQEQSQVIDFNNVNMIKEKQGKIKQSKQQKDEQQHKEQETKQQQHQQDQQTNKKKVNKNPTIMDKRIVLKAEKAQFTPNNNNFNKNNNANENNKSMNKVNNKNDDDIDDMEVRRIELLKDQKIQQQIQYERLRKEAMNEERLSKYLSRSGVCSRRQAEKMIQDGLIKVDGKVASSNLAVSPRNNIEIFTKRGEKFAPVKQNAKIWLFYKPRGMICSHDDPLNRPTVFDYIYNNTSIKEPHIKAVGRLDYNSEGLILLTNDGDIAQCLEQPESNIFRQYRVRVQGKLDETKMLKLKQGTVIGGVQYGPFQVEIDRRQTTNTWITVGLYTGKNREIRKVMQKFELRVSRLKRLSYGPYKIGKMLPGQIHETYVQDELKRKIYLYMRKKLQLSQSDMKTFLVDKFGEDIFLNNKSEDDLTLDKIAKKVYKELDQNSLRTQLLE